MGDNVLTDDEVTEDREWCLRCFRALPSPEEIDGGMPPGGDEYIEECRSCGGLRIQESGEGA